MYLSGLHGQGTSACAGRERRADAVHAGDDALDVTVDLAEHRQADARHDARADDDVRRVGELHADLRHGRSDRPHAERQHVHRAARHGAAEQLFQLRRISYGFTQLLVGPAPSFDSEQTKVRCSTRATSLAIRAGVVAAGPQVLIQRDERAALHHLAAQKVVLLLGAIHPVDRARPGRGRASSRPSEADGYFWRAARRDRAKERRRQAWTQRTCRVLTSLLQRRRLIEQPRAG